MCYYCDCCCIYPNNPFFSCLAGNENQKKRKTSCGKRIMKCYTPFNKQRKKTVHPIQTDKQQDILWESHIRPRPFHSTPHHHRPNPYSHIGTHLISIVSFCFALLSSTLNRESIMVSVSVSVSIFAPYIFGFFRIFTRS